MSALISLARYFTPKDIIVNILSTNVTFSTSNKAMAAGIILEMKGS